MQHVPELDIENLVYLHIMFQEVSYKITEDQYVIADDCPIPPERKPVLVLVEGQSMPYVAYIRIWSIGAWWVIPGGTPESHSIGERFKITHWCDCLPERNLYSHMLILGTKAR